MQTFNEFFIRELKPGARPIVCKERDDVAVCAADSRLMAFRTAEDSRRFWIKVHKLLALRNILRWEVHQFIVASYFYDFINLDAVMTAQSRPWNERPIKNKSLNKGILLMERICITDALLIVYLCRQYLSSLCIYINYIHVIWYLTRLDLAVLGSKVLYPRSSRAGGRL